MNCYFFGTFNPIHLGHIEISRRIKEKCGFDKVIFVPAYMPPHKIEGVVSYVDRLEMAKIAAGADCVSDIELHLQVPSYTYRTAQKLCEIENTSKINFIIGYDQFFKLESWKEPEKIRQLLNFIVIPRHFQNGQTASLKAFEYFKNKGYDFEIVDIGFLDVSSEMIRKHLEQNQDITGLTTQEVKNYIERHQLYKTMAQRKSIR